MPHRAPVLRVEVLLRQAEGAPPAAAVAEGGRQRVEAGSRRRDHDGHAAAERRTADRDSYGRRRQRGRRSVEGREAEALSQQRWTKAIRQRAFGCRAWLVRAAGREVRPVRLRDAPVAADLVAQVQPLGNAVVGLALAAGGELRDARQPLGREQAAFDGERLERELRLPRGSAPGRRVGDPERQCSAAGAGARRGR